MKRNIIFGVMALTIGILCGLSVYLYDYFYPKQYVKTESGSYINIAVANNPVTFPVTQNTQFEVEHYYADEQRTLTEQVGNIPALIGCDKAGVEKYLRDYMKHLSAEDREEGLASYELVSYNDNSILLKKTYKTPVYNGYYAKSFNGTIVILKGDERTVYEYTEISIDSLPEEIRKKVQIGYFLENEADLYSFLENYSS